MPNYLHGVETVIVQKGGRPITVVKSSVICLIGTAPKGPVNELTYIVNEADAAQFGERIPGFDIPHALEAIRQYGVGTIIVINVFNPDTMVAPVVAEVNTVTDFKFKLNFPPISEPVITNNAGSVTFVKDVDYTIDAFGNVKVLKPSVIAEGSSPKASYDKLDSGEITSADIIGDVDSGTNVRTGLQLLDEVYTTFGFTPKIILCPDWNTDTDVSAEIEAMAVSWRAVYPLDAAEGATPSTVITERGPSGTSNISTNSKRAIPVYPKFEVSDPDPSSAEDAVILRPFSEMITALMAFTDANEGYWVSPSNQKILGIVGPERKLTWFPNKTDSEVNQLNSYGVTSYIKLNADYRSWGNRNASYPVEEGIDTFTSMQRLADIIHESIEFAALKYNDKPINGALIDFILGDINNFFRTLEGRGAIVAGSCSFISENNPADDLANGNVKFDYEFVGGPPAERITFRSFTNVQLLKTIA